MLPLESAALEVSIFFSRSIEPDRRGEDGARAAGRGGERSLARTMRKASKEDLQKAVRCCVPRR